MFPRRVTRGALLGALIAVTAMMPPPLLSATPGLTAGELKAIFLLRLPQFVTWPAGQNAHTFCVVEASEISQLLEDMLADEPRGRVEHVERDGDGTVELDTLERRCRDLFNPRRGARGETCGET